jgi:hypothetical protein
MCASDKRKVSSDKPATRQSPLPPLPFLTKLNLGCGFDRREGFLNVDWDTGHRPDLIADVLDLNMLPTAAFEKIIARDILEHFRWRDTPRALYEWNKLLRSKGTIFIRTTYIIGLGKRFEYPTFQDIPNQKLLLTNLFSNQLVPGDYHLTAFTERLIRYYLWETGFEVNSLTVRDEWLLEIWATKIVDFYAMTAMPEGDHFRFVDRLYQQLLDREADGPGLDAHVKRLATGAIDRDRLVKEFLLSDERETRMSHACPEFELVVDQSRST